MRTEVITPPRPDEMTDEQHIEVCQKVAKDIVLWASHSRIYEESLVRDLQEVIDKDGWRCDNGYELAKKLEDHHGYRPDFEMVEALDNVWHLVEERIDINIAEWVATYNITPKHSLNDKVTIKLRGKEVEGVIVDIRHKHGIYGVRTPDIGNTSCYLIKYEDVLS